MAKLLKNDKFLGIFFILISSLFFALMNLFVKLSGDLPFIQKSFFRNIVALIICSIIIIKHKFNFKQLNFESYKFLILRSIFGLIGVLCNFYALDHLVLSDASILNKISPFFVIIFSAVFLKERLKPYQIISVVIAMIGVIFVIKPSNTIINSFPAIVGLIGGISAGASYTTIRKLRNFNTGTFFTVWFFALFSTIIIFPFFIVYYKPMTLDQILILLAIGIFAALGQLAITYAYSKAPGKEISIYEYWQIIFSALLGFIIFSQIPDLLSWIGYLIIICAAIYMFIKNFSTT